MTVIYTPLLGLAQPVTGTESGTWGDTINVSLTALLDTAIAGTKTADVTSGDWTLSDIDGADDDARAAVLIPTGTNGATTRSILAPNQSKLYVIINQATGSVVIKGATGPTTGVTITAGSQALVAWNGTDFVNITPSGNSGTVTSVAMTVPSFLSISGSPVTSSGTLAVTLSGTALPVANGGTGSTTGNLSSCTADGTNAVGYKNIPQSGSDKTTAYTLATTDVGKYIGVGTSGSIVVPASTFANGDAISIFNNTSGNITITINSPTTAYIAGTNTVKTSVTLATRGIANILFVSSTVCVLTGNVS